MAYFKFKHFLTVGGECIEYYMMYVITVTFSWTPIILAVMTMFCIENCESN
jgi:hypothetical protein